MSIEREQPSTDLRSMPHYTTYGGTYLASQPADELTRSSESFFGDELNVKDEWHRDKLTGGFNALNETTNFRHQQGESTSVIHPQFQEASKSVIHPQFRTGLINPDSMRSVDELTGTSESFGCGENNPISTGQPVEEPQPLADRAGNMRQNLRGDFIPGEGRPMNVWTNGSATSFEDRHVGDYDTNDAVFGMRQNLGTNSAPDGLTYITETFEPLAGMDSFAGSLNSVLGDSDTAGPLCKTYLEPQLGWSELCDVGLS